MLMKVDHRLVSGADVRALLKDADRLDWMERNPRRIEMRLYLDDSGNPPYYRTGFVDMKRGDDKIHETLREAIDAAKWSDVEAGY